MAVEGAPAFRIVIPARARSTRLPDKPLADVAGKPLIVRVLERARQAGADEVWVATDDARIATAVSAAGGQVVMTRSDHPTGTDRLAEVVTKLDWADDTVVVNVQGDEPLLDPGAPVLAALCLATATDCVMSTARHRIDSLADFLNPNVVKVVCSAGLRALTFSRAPIPWPRDAWPSLAQATQLPALLPAWRHIGLYAYRAGFLRRYPGLPPGQLEQVESLEQLRVLEQGHAIAVFDAPGLPAAGVDTPEDLERVRHLFAQGLI